MDYCKAYFSFVRVCVCVHAPTVASGHSLTKRLQRP